MSVVQMSHHRFQYYSVDLATCRWLQHMECAPWHRLLLLKLGKQISAAISGQSGAKEAFSEIYAVNFWLNTF